MHDHRDDWLLELGKSIGMPKLKFDKERFCNINLDEDIFLSIFKQNNNTDLGLMGGFHVSELQEYVLKKMLLNNRKSREQDRPVLSLSEDGSFIGVHLNMNYSQLHMNEPRIDRIVTEIEYWKSKLSNFKNSNSNSNSNSNLDNFHHGLRFV
ncbi:type III secretion system chaperone [Vibrio profundum]|uniref:CesT family type III secretion system chaperone n=1 Tax=Vibrio profundum TaxID=2910247 RepID=UPI003D0CB93C